jgi:hypothetical protein
MVVCGIRPILRSDPGRAAPITDPNPRHRSRMTALDPLLPWVSGSFPELRNRDNVASPNARPATAKGTWSHLILIFRSVSSLLSSCF